MLGGLRDEFKPQGALEESCVTTLAASYVRMAAMLRYENVAALKYHHHSERELKQRIAAANPAAAARLRAGRDKLRRAGLWRPTVPGTREAKAIARYSNTLDRSIRRAATELRGLKNMRPGSESPWLELQKQTHFEVSPRSGPAAAEGPRMASAPINENAKTNPLSSMFSGNRHERRRAKALAARKKWRPQT
jgi:hypothetical protein